MTDETLPVFRFTRRYSRKSRMWWVHGRCPYCGFLHRHGAGEIGSKEFDVGPETRRSHCGGRHQGGHYRLVEAR